MPMDNTTTFAYIDGASPKLEAIDSLLTKLSNQFLILNSSTDTIAVGVGEVGKNAEDSTKKVEENTKKIETNANSTAETFKKLTGHISDTAEAFDFLLAEDKMNALALVFGDAYTQNEKLQSGIQSVVGAIGMLGSFSSPLGMVVGLINVIVQIVKLVIDNWGTIGPFFEKLWQGIKEGFIGFVNFIIMGLNLFLKILLAPVNLVIAGWNATLGKLFGNIQNISIAIPLIPQFANGGFPAMGQLFIANERGPELIGNIGGKSAVANNDQIVSSISQGVFSAVKSALATNSSKGATQVKLFIDSREIARATAEGNRLNAFSSVVAAGGVL